MVTPFDAAERLNDVVCPAGSWLWYNRLDPLKLRGAANSARVVHILLDQIPTPIDGFGVDDTTFIVASTCRFPPCDESRI
jgi:hypothetical protein